MSVRGPAWQLGGGLGHTAGLCWAPQRRRVGTHLCRRSTGCGSTCSAPVAPPPCTRSRRCYTGSPCWPASPGGCGQPGAPTLWGKGTVLESGTCRAPVSKQQWCEDSGPSASPSTTQRASGDQRRSGNVRPRRRSCPPPLCAHLPKGSRSPCGLDPARPWPSGAW